MIVYRTMSSVEMLNLLCDKNIKNNNTIKGENTFKYNKDNEYIHFFKYEEHALYFMKKSGNPVIAKINIPDEILPPLSYGFYGDVDTYYDDALYGYYMPLPEYALDISLMKKEYIVDFSNNGVWKDPLRINDSHHYYFWVTRKERFKEETQMWTKESIYYQYVKILLSKFNYDMNKVTNFLLKIDLDEEIKNLAETIKKEKTITKRKYPRSN